MVTYKTFRGVTNTMNPGAYAFCKDKAPFEGYHMVKEMMGRKDRRAKEWIRLGFYDRNDIDYLCQHADLPVPIFRSRDLGIEVARSFL
ncbi:hypothetical protein IJH02_03605 [Candidatus Saccharibacteria bacterium]|nr:hypothetical protein [Candidatus Saccharibacteria bacterium]